MSTPVQSDAYVIDRLASLIDRLDETSRKRGPRGGVSVVTPHLYAAIGAIQRGQPALTTLLSVVESLASAGDTYFGMALRASELSTAPVFLMRDRDGRCEIERAVPGACPRCNKTEWGETIPETCRGCGYRKGQPL